VQVFAPAGRSPYHRLRWTEPDGTRGDTSGGRDLPAALARAHALDERLARAAGPAATTPLVDVVRLYLADGHSPHTGRPWHRSTRLQVEDQLNRCLRVHRDLRALDVTRDLLDQMRAQAGTPTMVRINTTALRALLLWGYRHSPSFFTAVQAELLPRGVVMPHPSLTGTAAPRRRSTTRRVGEAETYVHNEDAPSARQIIHLSQALGDRFPVLQTCWESVALLKTTVEVPPTRPELAGITLHEVENSVFAMCTRVVRAPKNGAIGAVPDGVAAQRHADVLAELEAFGVPTRDPANATEDYLAARAECEPLLAGLAEHLLYPWPPRSEGPDSR
jgi:hypothetical protein